MPRTRDVDVNEPGPDLSTARPRVAVELQPLATSMLGLQGVAADEAAGEWYMNQAARPGMPGEAGTPAEDTRIHRFGRASLDVDGVWRSPHLGTTEWVDAGHNSDLCVQRVGDRAYLWGQWIDADADGKTVGYRIVRTPWKPGRVDPSEAETVNVWERPTRSQSVVLDEPHGILIVRTYDSNKRHVFTRRRIADVLAGRNVSLGRVVLPAPTVYQGSASFGRHLYRATAKAIDGGPQMVERWDWTDGEKVDQVEVGQASLLPHEASTDWLEIEGLTVTSEYLYAGMKVHNGKRRRFRVMAVAPTPQFAAVHAVRSWPMMLRGVQA